jgi:hypothetical protein
MTEIVWFYIIALSTLKFSAIALKKYFFKYKYTLNIYENETPPYMVRFRSVPTTFHTVGVDDFYSKQLKKSFQVANKIQSVIWFKKLFSANFIDLLIAISNKLWLWSASKQLAEYNIKVWRIGNKSKEARGGWIFWVPPNIIIIIIL